jgi:hypothetical protein
MRRDRWQLHGFHGPRHIRGPQRQVRLRLNQPQVRTAPAPLQVSEGVHVRGHAEAVSGSQVDGLGNLSAAFGIEFKDYHRALADATPPRICSIWW